MMVAPGRNAPTATLFPNIRREHHLPAPHVCELLPRQRLRRLPRPSPPRPRRCSLPLATHQHSPNPRLRHWISLRISRLLVHPPSPSPQCDCHRIRAPAFPPNRFDRRLFRTCLLLRQLLLGSSPSLCQLVPNRFLHRRLLSCVPLRLRLLLRSYIFRSHTRSLALCVILSAQISPPACVVCLSSYVCVRGGASLRLRLLNSSVRRSIDASVPHSGHNASFLSSRDLRSSQHIPV